MKSMTLNPQRFGGPYLIDEDGSETIIINHNFWDLDVAEQRAAAIKAARTVEMTWWTLRYTMWLMVRPAGGEWIICTIRPWEQPLFSDRKSVLSLCVTDARDNSVLASAAFEFPDNCAERLSSDLATIAYNCACPPSDAPADDWVREYLERKDVSVRDILDRCDTMYQF